MFQLLVITAGFWGGDFHFKMHHLPDTIPRYLLELDPTECNIIICCWRAPCGYPCLDKTVNEATNQTINNIMFFLCSSEHHFTLFSFVLWNFNLHIYTNKYKNLFEMISTRASFKINPFVLHVMFHILQDTPRTQN